MRGVAAASLILWVVPLGTMILIGAQVEELPGALRAQQAALDVAVAVDVAVALGEVEEAGVVLLVLLVPQEALRVLRRPADAVGVVAVAVAVAVSRLLPQTQLAAVARLVLACHLSLRLRA
jgi:hypothetical protein